jgi:hypothetical protein
MRAYFVITGTIFALLALLQVREIVIDWSGFDSGLWTLLVTMSLCIALAVWAWRLFADLRRE